MVSIERPRGAQGHEHGRLRKRVFPVGAERCLPGGPAAVSPPPPCCWRPAHSRVPQEAGTFHLASLGDMQNSLTPRCVGKASPVSLGPPGLQSLRGHVPTCGSASPHDPGCFPAFPRDTENPATGRRVLLRWPSCTTRRRLCSFCRLHVCVADTPWGGLCFCALVVCADRLHILPLRDLNRALSAPSLLHPTHQRSQACVVL